MGRLRELAVALTVIAVLSTGLARLATDVVHHPGRTVGHPIQDTASGRRVRDQA
jgi:hypothetical protein